MKSTASGRASKPEPLTKDGVEIPTGLLIDAEDDLLVSDLRLGVVSRIPKGRGAAVTLARVPAPRGLAMGKAGELVVLSMGPDQLVTYSRDGTSRILVKGKPFKYHSF